MTQQSLPANDEARKAQEQGDLRWRMALQRRVELELNQLIQEMVKLVDEKSIASSGLEKTQFKNLLAVALETSSVEVIKHFILYQAGRDVAGTGWRRNQFGQSLVKALDGLKKDAAKVAHQTHRELDPQAKEPQPGQVDEAWLLLTRAYLGQLNRYFYFRKEERRWPQATS